MSAWTILLAIAASAGALWVLRKRRISKWFVASIPCWMASESGWFEFAAAILTLFGIIALAVGPTLPGRRRTRGDAPPLPHLANGPLVAVPSLALNTARRSRIITVSSIVFWCLAPVLAIWAPNSSDPPILQALALSSTIIAATFTFGNWFSSRVRVRIDQEGLHSRVFFAEQTIRWTEVGGITLRYVFMPGMGVRLIYYVVFSQTNEFSFASSNQGAKEMQAAIEAATGLKFPEPEITATM